MKLEIRAPEQFKNWCDLKGSDTIPDPREDQGERLNVVFDLRRSKFVRPAAALSLLVFCALHKKRGNHCEVLFPGNPGVDNYLRSLGIVALLKQQGIDINTSEHIPQQDSSIVLPLTFLSLETVAKTVADAELRLHSGPFDTSGDVGNTVLQVFAELASNAIEHSHSPVGSFGFIQSFDYSPARIFVCVVADGGIGVRKSLARNPSISRTRVTNDQLALAYAVEELVSGTGEKHRGIGLSYVVDNTKKPDRQLVIQSGLGRLQVQGTTEPVSEAVPQLFPGTIVYTSFPW